MQRIIMGLVCCLWIIVGADAPEASRPNVLLIAVDDLNDRIGCMGGHPQAKTPNLDSLAARGVLFTSAHSVHRFPPISSCTMSILMDSWVTRTRFEKASISSRVR